jgi:hypothetical protein
MYLCTKGFTQFPECATIHPPQRICENCGEFGTCCLKTESQERNFCPRCGKRTNDIHTCTPPQRTWVGLTKEEVDSWELPDTPTVAEFAWFVEAKVKEKNNA